MYVCMACVYDVCTYACLYVCMHACMYVCVSVCLSICLPVCHDGDENRDRYEQNDVDFPELVALSNLDRCTCLHIVVWVDEKDTSVETS